MKKLILLLMLLLSIGVYAQVTHVTLTYYQPVVEQCNNDPLITADGSKINLHHLKHNKIKWCAISRDLLWMFPKNQPKLIWIEGFGVYEVRDVMNKRFHHRVDILIHPKDSKRICLKQVKIKILSSHKVNRNHRHTRGLKRSGNHRMG
jgi:hypothetical protein